MLLLQAVSKIVSSSFKATDYMKFLKNGLGRVCKVVQQARIPAAKTDASSSIPRTDMVEGEN